MFLAHARPLIVLACAGALIAASPAAAIAAPRHGKATRHFAGSGLIVAHTATTATVLVRQLQDGTHRVTNRRITVTLATGKPAHAARAAAGVAATLVNGDQLILSGTSTGTGSSERFTATHSVQHAAPAHVFMGTVTAVNGSLLTVAKAATSREDDDTDGVDPGTFTVDASSAAVTVDGASGTVGVGQFVVVLGECDHDTVLASSLESFSATPTVLTGEVSAITGSIVTLGQDENTTSVDLTGVPLTLNGDSGMTSDAVTAGARLVVLGGTDGSGTFTPTVAFGFDRGDRGPVGYND